MCVICGDMGHAIGPWEVMVGSAAVYGVYDTVIQPIKRRLFGTNAVVQKDVSCPVDESESGASDVSAPAMELAAAR